MKGLHPQLAKKGGGVAGKVTSLDRKNVELKKLANLWMLPEKSVKFLVLKMADGKAKFER